MDRIATMDALAVRNVPVETQLCSLCSDGEESADHLIISCYIAAATWQAISDWCNIPPLFAFSIKELLLVHEDNRYGKVKKAHLQAVIYTTCWCIWKERNEAIFKNKRPSVSNIVREVKSLSFLWVKNRCRGGSIDSETWSNRWQLLLALLLVFCRLPGLSSLLGPGSLLNEFRRSKKKKKKLYH